MTQETENVVQITSGGGAAGTSYGGAAPALKAPQVVNFTVRMATGDGAEIMATTSFIPKEGESPNTLLDQVVDTLDRQRARSDVRNFDKEIATHEAAIEKGEHDIALLHEGTEVKIAGLKAKIVDAQAAVNRKVAELQKDHADSGSQRAFDMEKPGNKSEIGPMIRTEAEASAEIEALQTERLNGEKNFRSNMAMFVDKIAKMKKDRAERAALLT